MLKITNIPIGEPINKDFDITLNGRKAQAFCARVSAAPFNRDWPGKQRALDQTELVSILSFSADEPICVELIPSKNFKEVVVRPLSKNIHSHIQNGTIKFTIDHPGQYIVELDGPHNVLHIFADPIEELERSRDNENVLYFGPGIHYIGQMELLDDTTVFIDRDAFVYGSFYAVGSENIRILGHGVLCGSWENRQSHNFIFPYDISRIPEHMWGRSGLCHVFGFKPDLQGDLIEKEPYVAGTGTMLFKDKDQFKKIMEQMSLVKSGLHFYACKNVEINGIIIRDVAGLSNTWAACEGIIYNNVKIIGMWKYNSDGIDFYNCRNCIVKNSFVRSFDDGICMKGQTGWDTYNTENMLVENCVVWNDWGHSLEIGVDTVASEICNITFRDCDCIHHAHSVMDIGNCDRARIHDVLFENIRVEYSKYDMKPMFQKEDEECFVPKHYISQLFTCSVCDVNFWSIDDILGKNYDVIIRNINVLTDYDMEFPEIIVSGKDNEHTCENLIFENICFNGKKMTTEVELNIHANKYVRNVVVQ